MILSCVLKSRGLAYPGLQTTSGNSGTWESLFEYIVVNFQFESPGTDGFLDTRTLHFWCTWTTSLAMAQVVLATTSTVLLE